MNRLRNSPPALQLARCARILRFNDSRAFLVLVMHLGRAGALLEKLWTIRQTPHCLLSSCCLGQQMIAPLPLLTVFGPIIWFAMGGFASLNSDSLETVQLGSDWRVAGRSTSVLLAAFVRLSCLARKPHLMHTGTHSVSRCRIASVALCCHCEKPVISMESWRSLPQPQIFHRIDVVPNGLLCRVPKMTMCGGGASSQVGQARPGTALRCPTWHHKPDQLGAVKVVQQHEPAQARTGLESPSLPSDGACRIDIMFVAASRSHLVPSASGHCQLSRSRCVSQARQDPAAASGVDPRSSNAPSHFSNFVLTSRPPPSITYIHCSFPTSFLLHSCIPSSPHVLQPGRFNRRIGIRLQGSLSPVLSFLRQRHSRRSLSSRPICQAGLVPKKG